jgi:hypothetical protein
MMARFVELEKAVEYCHKAEEIFREFGFDEGLLDTYNTLCNTYRRMNKKEYALKCIKEGEKVWEERDKKVDIQFPVGRTNWLQLYNKLNQAHFELQKAFPDDILERLSTDVTTMCFEDAPNDRLEKEWLLNTEITKFSANRIGIYSDSKKMYYKTIKDTLP